MSIFQPFIVTGFVFISVFGILGNSFTIYVLKPTRRRSKLKQIMLLIYYLAILDLISIFFNPTLFLYCELSNHTRWDFGEFLCKFLPSFRQISTDVSLGMILFITIDRALIITNTRKIILTCRKIRWIVLVIILVSYLLSYLYHTCTCIFKLHYL